MLSVQCASLNFPPLAQQRLAVVAQRIDFQQEVRKLDIPDLLLDLIVQATWSPTSGSAVTMGGCSMPSWAPTSRVPCTQASGTAGAKLSAGDQAGHPPQPASQGGDAIFSVARHSSAATSIWFWSRERKLRGGRSRSGRSFRCLHSNILVQATKACRPKRRCSGFRTLL